jgi:hypothetical protein
VRSRSWAPGVRPCTVDRSRPGNSSLLPGPGRRWLGTGAVPYTGATGAADPATGVPRNLRLRLRAAVVRRAVPAQGASSPGA